MLEINLDPVKPGWPWVGITGTLDVHRHFGPMICGNYAVSGAIFFGDPMRAVFLSHWRSKRLAVIWVSQDDRG